MYQSKEKKARTLIHKENFLARIQVKTVYFLFVAQY
jgi:hypothetical protein